MLWELHEVSIKLVPVVKYVWATTSRQVDWSHLRISPVMSLRLGLMTGQSRNLEKNLVSGKRVTVWSRRQIDAKSKTILSYFDIFGQT